MRRSIKIVKNEEAMFALATSFVNDLQAQKSLSSPLCAKGCGYKLKAATIMGLTGELGAGKTTFVQGVARALGVRERVTSPTFVIMKIYKLSRQPWKHLVHIDAYRLESAEELCILGWDEIARDPANLIMIEWAEKVHSLLPRGYRATSFKCIGEGVRRVSL